MSKVSNIIVGLGEVGNPLFEIIRGAYPDTVGIDPGKGQERPESIDSCEFLHICIPGGLENFAEITESYLGEISVEKALIIHSTVLPGTTRKIKFSQEKKFHSPVNGKHSDMKRCMIKYPKFVSACSENPDTFDIGALYKRCGLDFTYVPGGTEVTELGKILATTAYGYNIAWAQEVERICEEVNVKWQDVVKCYEEIESPDFTMKGKFPGATGGHCVRENLWLIGRVLSSSLFDFILDSDKKYREDHGIDPEWRR